MAKLLTLLVLACVGVTLATAGSLFPWERDQEERENSYLDQGEPSVDKNENPKDFIGSMMRRIFGKSESPDEPRLRPAREAVGPMRLARETGETVGALRPAGEAVEPLVAAKKTTKRPATTKRPTTKKPPTTTPRKSGSSTPRNGGVRTMETVTLVPVVLAFSAVCLQWFQR